MYVKMFVINPMKYLTFVDEFTPCQRALYTG